MTNEQLIFVFTFVFGPLWYIASVIFKSGIIDHPLSWILSDNKIARIEKEWTSIFGELIYILLRVLRFISVFSIIFSLFYQTWFWFIYVAKIG